MSGWVDGWAAGRLGGWAAALLVAGGAATIAAQAPQEPVDLLIVNARIVDGTGAPARAGSLAIHNGRITRINPPSGTQARQRIDAGGQVVAPGFIDVHTHADGLADQPHAINFVRMGVTTIVAGNCGGSALDVGAAFEKIADAPPAVNYATLIGHNTVRSSVMGRAQRSPSASELQQMKALVFKGMADGAVGFSTGLQYIPGTYAESSEIIELARVAANEGGIYVSHMRNEGTALLEAVAETINVGRLLRMPVQISHLKVDSPKQWGASAKALALIDDARRRGIDVEADQYAYTAGSSGLAIRFPSWALEGTNAEVTARLKDDATWARIRNEIVQLLAERGFTDLSWATVATYRPQPEYNGLSMKAVAQKMIGADTADAQLEAARRMMMNGGASMVYHFMSEDDVETIMKHPMVGFASDAGINVFGSGVPHPRGYGNAVRILGRYVRERRVISLEEAVRKLASVPARQFGFAERGEIREGWVADLVIFDPATVGDTATFDAPHAYPTGISHVLVNGQLVVQSGEAAPARPGQVLRHQRR
ncbi:MAG: D-aminoacylase [Acidimicrobiia bacterium]|nr:D-aminoacylase [Acidimicrobiia bacterium]